MIKYSAILSIFLLASCGKAILEDDLVLVDNLYYESTNLSKPFSGKVFDKFSSGEISSQKIVKNGIIKKSEHYGYDQERVGGSAYQLLNDNVKDVKRIVLAISDEGEASKYYRLILIVNDSISKAKFLNLKDNVLTKIDLKNYFLDKNTVSFYLEARTGELESYLFKYDLSTQIN